MFAKFQVYSQPVFVIVDANGTAHAHLGAMDPDELDQLLTASLSA